MRAREALRAAAVSLVAFLAWFAVVRVLAPGYLFDDFVLLVVPLAVVLCQPAPLRRRLVFCATAAAAFAAIDALAGTSGVRAAYFGDPHGGASAVSVALYQAFQWCYPLGVLLLFVPLTPGSQGRRGDPPSSV